jgi:hypothetical protein
MLRRRFSGALRSPKERHMALLQYAQEHPDWEPV